MAPYVLTPVIMYIICKRNVITCPSVGCQHQQRHALQMVKESPQSLPASVSSEFKQHIVSILSRVEKRKANLDILANLYEFYDSVSAETI